MPDFIAQTGPGQERYQFGVLLDNTANFSSTPLKRARGTLSATVIRYMLQAAARELWLKVWGWQMEQHSSVLLGGPAPKSHRVVNCLRVPHARHVDVLHVPATSTGAYRGLQTCGSVWACAVCAAKISERRRVELASALEAARRMGYKIMFVTYTLPHKDGDDLDRLVNGLQKARTGLVSGRASQEFRRAVGWLGSVRGLEVTHGGNGWHPHMHELMFVDPGVTVEQLRDLLFPRWAAEVARVGLGVASPDAFDVSDSDKRIAEYVAKHDHLPRWRDEHELAKQVSKSGRMGSSSPADLLWAFIEGDSAAGMLWLEYASVMQGQSQLRWSPGLRAELGLAVEKSDEDVAAEVEHDAVLLARLSLSEWRLVLAADLRAQLLEAAATGDPGAVWAVLDPLKINSARDTLRASVPF